MASPYQLIDKVSVCAEVVSRLLRETEIAVDIEGVDLCRTGQVCLIQIASPARKVFLFDITTMGAKAFSWGLLTDLLESFSVTKVLCDGRADSDALYHIYGVRMNQVYDIQVLHALVNSNEYDRYVKGLQRILDDVAVIPEGKQAQLKEIKQTGRRLFKPDLGGSYDVWQQRPLHKAMIEYAVADVQYILAIKAKWGSPSRDSLVRSITLERIGNAVRSPHAHKGQHMSIRDFPLPSASGYFCASLSPGWQPGQGSLDTMAASLPGSSQAWPSAAATQSAAPRVAFPKPKAFPPPR